MKKSVLVVMIMAFMGMLNAQSHYWSPITGNQYNMLVTGVIVIDGEQQAVTTLEIGAFCGDECRASSFAQLFPPTGDYVVTMTILSQVINGETITFRLYDHVTQQVLDLDCESEVEFVADTHIGSMNDWYQFSFVTPPIHNTTSGSWSDPTIWNIIPDATSSVIIEADCTIDEDVEVANLTVNDGVTLTIESGNTLVVNGDLVNADEDGLVIEDGAQVINESPNVKASVKKDIQAYTSKDTNGWHLIASAVNEMPVAGSEFIVETYDLFRLNEETCTWENYRQHYNTDFMFFENGRGYLYANSNTISPAFKGDLNYEEQKSVVTYTETSSLKGLNIIGNPFPHVIYKGAGGAIDDSKLASGYYVLTYDGQWQVKPYSVAIQPGQGVLVQTTEAGNVAITKTNASATSETSAKDAARQMAINVSGNGKSDCAYVYFSEGIGLNKIDNYSSSAAQIAVKVDESDYAIAHVGEECEEMDVIFKNTKNGYYTVTIDGMEDYEYLHLIDNITGIDTDMQLEGKYKFHALGNEDENRFKIVCREIDAIGESTVTSDFAYIAGGNIIVSGEGTLQIIDMTGRIVNTMTVNGMETVCTSSLNNGVYILKLNGMTQKIVVK